jgi:hypothetical protein
LLISLVCFSPLLAGRFLDFQMKTLLNAFFFIIYNTVIFSKFHRTEHLCLIIASHRRFSMVQDKDWSLFTILALSLRCYWKREVVGRFVVMFHFIHENTLYMVGFKGSILWHWFCKFHLYVYSRLSNCSATGDIAADLDLCLALIRATPAATRDLVLFGLNRRIGTYFPQWDSNLQRKAHLYAATLTTAPRL